MQIILQRRAGKKEAVFCIELPHSFGNLAVFVLDFLSFIDDDVLPFELHKNSHRDPDTLVGGDNNIKLVGQKLVFQDLLSPFFGGN